MDTPLFDGMTYDEERDRERLGCQFRAVFALMSDGQWRTPEQMEAATGYRWASISARLRDFRKNKFGGHTVCRENRGGGTFVYRLMATRSVVPRHDG